MRRSDREIKDFDEIPGPHMTPERMMELKHYVNNLLKEKIYVMNKRKSIIVYNTEGENKGLIVPPQGYI